MLRPTCEREYMTFVFLGYLTHYNISISSGHLMVTIFFFFLERFTPISVVAIE